MKDNRSEIPAKAYINAQIIELAEQIGAFDEPTRQLEKSWNLEEGALSNLGIANVAHLAGLLYCLFVVPKEPWLEHRHHRFFDDIDKDKLLNLVQIEIKTEAFDKSPCYCLLRHLRNSIAHVNFTWIESVFTFWDRKPRTKEETFRAAITIDNLKEFIAYVGPRLADLRINQLHHH